MVLVVLDTLRPDHLGFRGYGWEPAPFLAELAERGTVFERAYSVSSWTVPATASIFTGLYPTQHGVMEGLFAHRERQAEIERTGGTRLELRRIPEEIETLPELLQAAGYRTFGIGANHNIGAGYGFKRGFDRFVRLQGGQTTSRKAHRLLMEWASEIEVAPSFLYLHLNDAHLPYRARDGYGKRVKRNSAAPDSPQAYDSEIAFLDHWLAKMALDLNWNDDTVIAVVSDHGEEFGEHGAYGHKELSLHREVNDALFLIAAPGHGVQPQRVTANVSQVDLLPSLLALLEIDAPNDVVGLNLLPVLLDNDASADLYEALRERSLFAHRLEWTGERHLFSVVRGAWKLISEPGIGSALFDLAKDPRELADVVEEHPDIARELLTDLDAFRADSRSGSQMVMELDAADLEALESLGYVED